MKTELVIGWGLILKLGGTGVLVYIVTPALLVFRDLFLWKIIEKFILNEKLIIAINLRASAVYELNSRYNKKEKIEFGRKGRTVYLDGEEVSEDEYQWYWRRQESLKGKERRAGRIIQWRSNLLNWLLRHYKQHGESNPIPEVEEEAHEKVEARHLRRVTSEEA
ncbi:hypothetical protein LOS15_07610 [Halomonas sp. 7T]|uniref:hypothetical protein n=1 Tax=Halomonas sp. 7T TaxID=2893469 RepID=UPI0021D84AFC|nr:hypothetical protein [Halomonas sp. 7T]UXZ55877.1 hypothetical protein LOS15_07610 [Halomonas sp. 7T]